MKKTITNLLLGMSAVFIFNEANAQFPIITSTNQLHSIGDNINYIDLNSFGFDPILGGGADVIWDYSALFDAGTTVDFNYVDPSTAPSSGSYPTANAALEISTVTGNEWYLESASSIIRLGLSSPDPNLGDLIYDNGAFIRFQFPFTAGDSWSTVSYSGTQSGDFGVPGTIITVANGSFSASVDAFGTMTLPNGAIYEDVVRIHVLEQFDFLGDIGVGAPLNLGTVTDDFYYWWVESIQDPILISGTTSVSGGAPTDVLRYQPVTAGSVGSVSVEEIDLEARIVVYPNPSNGVFNINIPTELNENVKVKVFNVLGEVVFANEENGIVSQLNLSHLEKGMYYMNISNDNFKTTKQIVIK